MGPTTVKVQVSEGESSRCGVGRGPGERLGGMENSPCVPQVEGVQTALYYSDEPASWQWHNGGNGKGGSARS
jgi:hypothetical protein